MPRAESRPSPIAGAGLFSVEAIAAGATVVQQDGIGDLNHSCDPNLGWSGAGVLVARRDIAPGEEFTLDYATVLDDASFVLMCHCETYRCRQIVEGTDWQIPQLQARYAGHWHPAVQSRIDAAR